MKWIAIIGRTLLGLIYLFAVVSFLLQWGEMPELNEDAANFSLAMMNSGFIYVVKFIEGTGALLLISGQYVRFASLWLLPVTVNIFLYHAMIMQDSLGMSAAMLLVNVFLLYYYREDLKVVLKR